MQRISAKQLHLPNHVNWLILITLSLGISLKGYGQYDFHITKLGQNQNRPDGAPPYYMLTSEADNHLSGALWSKSKIDLDEPFELTFYMKFGQPAFGDDGADGMVIVFHNDRDPQSSQVLGQDGGDIGYSSFSSMSSTTRISNSVAIEFDTYSNPTSDQVVDIGEDHIDIIPGGVQATVLSASSIVSNSLLPNGGPIPVKLDQNGNPVNIEDGLCHTVRVRWTPNLTNRSDDLLEVFFDDMLTPRCVLRKNLLPYFSFSGTSHEVWWGITASVGNEFNYQTIGFFPTELKGAEICPGDSVQIGTELIMESANNTYLWSPSAGLSCTTCASPIASPSATTIYTVKMDGRNSRYCEISGSVEVKVKDFALNAGNDEEIFCGESIQLNASVSPSDVGTTYSWSPSAGLSSTSIANPVASPSSTTTYAVTAFHPTTGCTLTSQVTFVVKPLVLTIEGPAEGKCSEPSLLKGIIAPVQSGIQYEWKDANGNIIGTSQNVLVSPSSTSTYTLKITNSVGCVYETSYTLIMPTFEINPNTPNFVKCGEEITFSATVAPTQNDVINYSWYKGSQLIQSSSSPTISLVFNSNTQVTVTAVNTRTGCSATATRLVAILMPMVYAGADKAICSANESVQLKATGYVIASPIFEWTPSTGLSCTDCPDPLASPTSTTTYTITVRNSYGCSASDEVKVSVGLIIAEAENLNICLGETVQLKLKGETLPNGCTFSWTPNENISDPTVLEPFVTPKQTTTYTLKIISPMGCSITIPVTVTVSSSIPFEFDYKHSELDKSTGFRSVAKTSDCDHVVGGQMYYDGEKGDISITRFNESGVEEWTYSYSRTDRGCTEDVAILNDLEPVYELPGKEKIVGHVEAGGIVETCNDLDFHVMKIDLEGNVLNSFLFGTSLETSMYPNYYMDEAYSVIQTSDGGYIAAGYTNGYSEISHDNFDFLVVKLDENFEFEWANTYGDEYDDVAIDIIETSDSGFLVGGYTMSYTNNTHYDVLLIKTNSNGVMQWASQIGGLGYEEFSSVCEIPGFGTEPNYIVYGATTSPGVYGIKDVFVSRINSIGTEITSAVIGTTGYECVGTANIRNATTTKQVSSGKLIASDSNLVFTLLTNTTFPVMPNGLDPSIVSIGSTPFTFGPINWQSKYRVTDQLPEEIGGLVENADGSYNLVGSAWPYGSLVRTNDVGATKCKSDPGYQIRPIFFYSYGVEPNYTCRYNIKEHEITKVAKSLLQNTKCEPGNISCLEEPGHPNLISSSNFPTHTPGGLMTDLHYNPSPSNFTVGDFTLVPDSRIIKPYWSGSDHSGDNSNILVSQGASIAGVRARYDSVQVDSNHTYLFCIWAKNLCQGCPVKPQVELRSGGIYGEKISNATTLDFTEGWMNISGLYTSNVQMYEELDVVVKSSMPGQGGDFALDDIVFIDVTGFGNPGHHKKESTNLPKENYSNEVRLYPNPVTKGKDLSLDLGGLAQEVLSLNFFDIHGKSIDIKYRLKSESAQIITQGISAGIYIVQIHLKESAISYIFSVVE